MTVVLEDVLSNGNETLPPTGGVYNLQPKKFRKKLRWLVQSPPTGSLPMTIGPDEADEILSMNRDDDGENLNRPLSAARVSDYCRQIDDGLWVHTGQPIIISKSGRLLDGQHRLHAIIQSNRAVNIDVRFGAPDDAFSVIDIGKPRSVADIFSIHKVKDPSLMAAATRWVLAIENDEIHGKNTHDFRTKLNPGEYYEEFISRKKLDDSRRIAWLFKRERLLQPALAVALHYLCSRRNPTLADEFFENIAGGFGFKSKRSADYTLYRKLVKNLGATEKLPAFVLAAFVVKGWNAFRDGRNFTTYRWQTERDPDEPFPRIR